MKLISRTKILLDVRSYPAANISLRSARRKVLSCRRQSIERTLTIGTVDGESATWMTHPGAIICMKQQSYFVDELNLEEHIARLRPIESDYYTESLRGTEITVLTETAQAAVLGSEKSWGELQVTTQVTGFRKRRWYTHENLGEEPLDLPPSDLQTTGYWLSISES